VLSQRPDLADQSRPGHLLPVVIHRVRAESSVSQLCSATRVSKEGERGERVQKSKVKSG
jgi:hypothetical protein